VQSQKTYTFLSDTHEDASYNGVWTMRLRMRCLPLNPEITFLRLDEPRYKYVDPVGSSGGREQKSNPRIAVIAVCDVLIAW